MHPTRVGHYPHESDRLRSNDHVIKLMQFLTNYGWHGPCGLAGWTLAVPQSGQAATTTVNVENFDFNPAAVTINVNDSIHWVWVSGFHNSISDPGDTTMWNSGNMTAPAGSFR